MTRKGKFLIMGKSIFSYDENGNLIKFCKKCKTFKLVGEFYQNLVSRKDGTERINYATNCKICSSHSMLSEDQRKRKNDRKKQSGYVREYGLKHKFGITVEYYDALWNAQNGVCAICEQPETTIHFMTGEVLRLAVDHCHKTGKIRGLLCNRCNYLLGILHDDPTYIRRVAGPLADYLEKK